MNEINLLRWRQIEDGSSQKKRLYLVLTAILFFIFLMLHFVLNNACINVTRVLSELKNKTSFYQNTRIDESREISIDEINQMQLSQKKWRKTLDFLLCLGRNHIQISGMNFQEKQVGMAGQTNSTVALSAAVQFCLGEKNRSVVKKIIFNRKSNSDRLQFSLVII